MNETVHPGPDTPRPPPNAERPELLLTARAHLHDLIDTLPGPVLVPLARLIETAQRYLVTDNGRFLY